MMKKQWLLRQLELLLAAFIPLFIGFGLFHVTQANNGVLAYRPSLKPVVVAWRPFIDEQDILNHFVKLEKSLLLLANVSEETTHRRSIRHHQHIFPQ